MRRQRWFQRGNDLQSNGVNPMACHFDPPALVCKGAKTNRRLLASPKKNEMKDFAGRKTSYPDQVNPGYPWDLGMVHSRLLPGLLHLPVFLVKVSFGCGPLRCGSASIPPQI
jgi:hypothetical protein